MPKTWNEQFVAGLRRADGEDAYNLDPVTSAEGDGDSDHELFVVGWNALAHDYIHKALTHLEDLDRVVESPIERALLLALCTRAHTKITHVRYKVADHVFGDFDKGTGLLQIEPQAKLGEYRVDFLLTLTELAPDFDRPTRLADGMEIPGSKEVQAHLIIECDGHDFHDRTKEQASKDRRRDRELKKLGYDVFRYTGSDIWSDPVACADEVIEAIQRGAGDLW